VGGDLTQEGECSGKDVELFLAKPKMAGLAEALVVIT